MGGTVLVYTVPPMILITTKGGNMTTVKPQEQEIQEQDVIDFKWRFNDELQFDDIRHWRNVSKTEVPQDMLIMGFVEVNGERVNAIALESNPYEDTDEEVLYVKKVGNAVHMAPGCNIPAIHELCENMTLTVLGRYTDGRTVRLTED